MTSHVINGHWINNPSVSSSKNESQTKISFLRRYPSYMKSRIWIISGRILCSFFTFTFSFLEFVPVWIAMVFQKKSFVYDVLLQWMQKQEKDLEEHEDVVVQ